MNRETRIKTIQEIINRDKPFGNQEIPWMGVLVSKNVYQIPLKTLIYNKYNGRILSRTKSLERQHYTIDVESEVGKKHIEKLLWDSNETRNKKTTKSIELYGQQKVGIITKDGIIIDGNRRAMLLNKTGKSDYFKTIVLDVTLDENPLEIEKLETLYQMGEDEKVGYNATEKYIKSKELYKKLTQQTYSSNPNKHTPNTKVVKDIANWMGQDDSEILKYLNTMEIMDEYLEFLEYDGIYTQLDKREDQFLNLTKWLKTFYGESSRKAFDGYTDGDVDELKSVAFDYIRAKYEGKEFRLLAEGLNSKHFFGDKLIWKSFYNYHIEKVTPINDSEERIDYNSTNLNKHLDDRDSKFLESTKIDGVTSFLEENIEIHQEKLGNRNAAEQPLKLVNEAFDKLNAIKIRHPSFAKVEVQNQVEEIGNKIFSMLQQNSTASVLSKIIKLLEDIDVDKLKDSETEEIKEKATIINKLSYQILKKL